MPVFHLAFPVADLDEAERFYADVLGCPIGRRAPRWIDFDFWGHQLSAHLIEPTTLGVEAVGEITSNAVDGDAVPTRHFGVVLPWDEWEAVAARLREAEVPFLIEPRVRFEGQPGEQGTFFVLDPSGNAVEMKSFRDMDNLFAR